MTLLLRLWFTVAVALLLALVWRALGAVFREDARMPGPVEAGLLMTFIVWIIGGLLVMVWTH